MERIIIIGHGSPKRGANVIQQVGDRLHASLHPNCTQECVKAAYLEFAEPDIMGAVEACVTEGARRIIVHPFFLASGVHVSKDIPETLDEARSRFPEVEIEYTEPLGLHDKLIDIVRERIGRGRLSPEEIETASFGIIDDEVDLSGFPAEQQPIIRRVIHATADFEFARTLRFHPDAVRTGLEAIKAGKDVLTDVEMLRAGINKPNLTWWGGKAICRIQEEVRSEKWEVGSKDAGAYHDMPSGTRPETPACRGSSCGCPEMGLRTEKKVGAQFIAPAEADEKQTRSEQGIERGLRENPNVGIVAIGNAPTALLKAIEIVAAMPAAQRPLVVGVPVGFVKAFESKALLATQDFPFITNLSRKGGSPVAAAIVNALLKMAKGGEGR